MILLKSKKGFSLVELAIVMACYAVLVTAVVPIFINHFNKKASEKTAYEILTISDAVRNYYIDNSVWPDSIEELKVGQYIDPNWSANNPWGSPYSLSSAGTVLSVSSQVPDNLVENVKLYLPVVSSSGDVVESTVTAPERTLPSNDNVPSGVIAFWSGLIADIPDGWELSNGSCSVPCPDLRDKFIVGASTDQAGETVTGVDGSFSKEGGRAYIDFYHTHVWGSTSEFETDKAVACVSGDCVSVVSGNHTHGSDYVGSRSLFTVPEYYAVAFIIKGAN